MHGLKWTHGGGDGGAGGAGAAGAGAGSQTGDRSGQLGRHEGVCVHQEISVHGLQLVRPWYLFFLVRCSCSVFALRSSLVLCSSSFFTRSSPPNRHGRRPQGDGREALKWAEKALAVRSPALLILDAVPRQAGGDTTFR